jgi:hypothetical protein
MLADVLEMLSAGRRPEVAHQQPLPVLSLWKKAVYYLAFFTTHGVKFRSHFEEEREARGFYRCLGEDCPACAAGVKATEHVYIPVWDVRNRRIAVLKFDARPDSPAVKVLEFLAAYQEQMGEVIAEIVCDGLGRGSFTITARKAPPETDLGVPACTEFCARLDKGEVDPGECSRALTAAEVAALPSVRGRSLPALGEEVLPARSAPPPPPADGAGEPAGGTGAPPT